MDYVKHLFGLKTEEDKRLEKQEEQDERRRKDQEYQIKFVTSIFDGVVDLTRSEGQLISIKKFVTEVRDRIVSNERYVRDIGGIIRRKQLCDDADKLINITIEDNHKIIAKCKEQLILALDYMETEAKRMVIGFEIEELQSGIRKRIDTLQNIVSELQK